ncbi:hypothetical protein CTI12_AA247680 [Artemisia annua]|uniref:Ubiquitin-like protease family profile domain-containing protein n=1 Tax=Artemisia annua TaxID=35608 RepID=A0A2U1NN61_ARTAN|nr:hypothetical protein CTI12_AA247680 [Artemisia annua]
MVSKPKKSLKKAIVEVKSENVLKPKERAVKAQEKVFKPKKVLKPKKECVVKAQEKVSKKLKSEPNEIKNKPLTPAQIKKEEFLSKFPSLLSRTVPASLFSTIRDARVDMKSFLEDIGFSSLHGVNIEKLPSHIAGFVVAKFSTETYELSLDKGKILVTPEKIHEIFEVLLGGTYFFDLPERSTVDPFVLLWIKQFHPKKYKQIRAIDVAGKLITATEVDFMFKVNFLTLLANVMAKAHKMKALVDLTIVRRISEDTNIANIDWCEYIYRCLKYSEKPKTPSGFYNGALCFLILLYFDSTKFEGLPIISYRPAIQNWNSSLMNQHQKLEIEREEIGIMELHGEWSESEVQGTEGFFDGSVKVRQAHSSRVPPTDKQKEFFAKFLLEHKHPKADNVMNVKGRVLQPKWKTNDNHVDCGVFAMIHMESYVGEPIKDWDAGLCQESDMQVSLLRRMRFKIATKILLHELNLHSQKMYDLAFQFQEIE